jgi:YfiH family protein
MSEIVALTSPLLAAQPGVRHAFFTRQGGVSEGVYTSFNQGLGSKDQPGHVLQNRRRAARHLGVEARALLTAYQIHSAHALTVGRPWALGQPPEGDAIATATPGLACGALAADCAPILIADADAGVVAAVHAGWKGALGGVIASAVEAMGALGAAPARMTAAIGPCIGPQSYEVGLEFLERFVAGAPGAERFFQPGAADDKRLFDLPAFVLERLDQAGVGQSEWIGLDTYPDADRFYSNRRALHRGEADYGRLLSAIMLAADT